MQELQERTHSGLSVPTQANQRLEFLDVLRGASLLGIVFANMIGYSLYLYLPQADIANLSTFAIDKRLDFIELALIEGKFYTIFSALFGIGFSILLRNRIERGQPFLAFFSRRMFYLFLIGVGHAILFWHNDILQAYAVCGLGLLAATRLNPKYILGLSGVFLFLPPLIEALQIMPSTLFVDQRSAVKSTFDLTGATIIELRGSSSWVTQFQLNMAMWFGQWSYLITGGMIFRVFGLFLLGYWLGLNEIPQRLAQLRPVIVKCAIVGFVIGLPVSVHYAATFYSGGLLHSISETVGASMLALGYAAALCLWWLGKGREFLTRIFAPVGRMALTNYVGQSVIGVIMFYGTGLALGGHVGPVFYFPIGLAIYVLQVFLSTAWLSNFKFGPLEWVWRSLTYGSLVPLRSDNKIGS